MIRQRLLIPLFVGLLALLLAVLGRNLWIDLEELSTAGNDNAQWTILQLDTEFANLQAALLVQAAKPTPDLDTIRLRTDITLSRIALVSRGNASNIIATDPRALALLESINAYADEAIELVDGDLSRPDIQRLIEITSDTAPLARRLALRGIQIGADRSEAGRLEFSNKLRNTGLIAILVIGILAAVLMLLDRLLWIAREKDNALRASTKRLKTMITGSLDAIVICDADGRIVDFNPAAERIFDWRKGELTGLDVGLLLPQPSETASGQARGGAAGSFREFLDRDRVEIMARRRTGEVFPADLTVTSAGAGTEGLVLYLRDISKQKLDEQALVDAKERAERTDRAKSQFLTVMSHEMRTPLNGVLGVLDLLRTTRLSGRQRRFVEVATASGEVLMRHVNEALDITRIETGSLVLSAHRFNLAEEVGRVTEVLEPLAMEKGIEMSLEIDPGMTMDFVADGNRIGQIVMNLVGNAIKFTASGSIAVKVSGLHAATGTTAWISVADTGVGIPEDSTEAIFEDFVALSHSSGRMSRSDGLGLPISRKAARLMGGDITVSSAPGKGSEFKLTLPLERASGPAESANRDPGLTDRQAEPARPVHVLVIDDNTINLTVLREMLEGMGHSVATAANGAEGFKAAMGQPFEVIFMDINMPDMDGIELTRRIRASDGPNRTSRIHGLTAYGEEEFRDPAIAAGMNGFSNKPIRMQTLAAILRDKPAEAPVSPVKAGAIDVVVVNELRDALGDARLRQNAGTFFSEMEALIAELRQPGGTEARLARLHDLSGAAALFGLRALVAGIRSLEADIDQQDGAQLAPAVERLRDLARDTQARFFKALDTPRPAKSGAAPPGETAGAARDARGG